jgi:hypothetical protein
MVADHFETVTSCDMGSNIDMVVGWMLCSVGPLLALLAHFKCIDSAMDIYAIVVHLSRAWRWWSGRPADTPNTNNQTNTTSARACKSNEPWSMSDYHSFNPSIHTSYMTMTDGKVEC